MKKPGVVVTGGDFQGLGVLRTFGEKNIPVMLIDSGVCIGRYSRYALRYHKCPDPFHEKEYLVFLESLARRENIEGWVLFANSDQIVRVFSQNKKSLEKSYRVPTPAWNVIKYVYIKENTYRLAKENGIPIPETYFGLKMEELLDSSLSFPVVLKPSIRDNFYSKVRIKAFLVRNKDELARTYRRISRVIDPSEILVQEFIAGAPKNLYSYCPFFKDGKSIASISGRRARQHPMDFGHATTYAEPVEIPEIQKIAEKFLGLIRYYGLAEVEFMKDSKDNSFKLIEINPRVWGWHSLAINSGVDLPYLMYCDILGKMVEVPATRKTVKWIRIATDLPTVAKEVWRRRLTVREYLRTMRGKKKDAVWSWKDPIPFFVELMLLTYFRFKKGF